MEPNTENSTQPIVQPPQNVFEVKPGGAWARFWACVIDGMVLSVPALIVTIAWILLLETGFYKWCLTIREFDNININIIVLLWCYFVYYIYFTSAKGTTVGKDAYGLKVVKFGTEEKITYGKSAIRELVKIGVVIIPVVGILFYVANGFVIIFSKQKRGLHDRAANSQVLKYKHAWRMRKQLLFFAVYFLLVITLVYFTLNSSLLEVEHPGFGGRPIDTTNSGNPQFSNPNIQVLDMSKPTTSISF
jgi:uncharacterized RDD family membrane protein YckC